MKTVSIGSKHMLLNLSADIICSEKLLYNSADKYPTTFSYQMQDLMFLFLQIFFLTKTREH